MSISGTLVWFEPNPVSFPVASHEQPERIAGALNAKLIGEAGRALRNAQ